MANTFQIASYDPVALERNKRMAEMLMKQQGNVNNGTMMGALATALQGGLAGYASSKATQQEQARNQALAEILKQKGGTATGDYGTDQAQLAAILDPRFAYQKERDTKSDSFDREKFDYAKSTDARDFDFKKETTDRTFKMKERELGMQESRYGLESMKLLAEVDKLNREGNGLDFEKADKLRDEFVKQSGDFVKVRDAYQRINQVDDTPAGQMSMIFNYMKMLDPGSTVREGEYAKAGDTTGVPGKIVNAYNKAVRGDEINPEQIADFRNQAQKLYSGSLQTQKLLENRYTDLANTFNVRPDVVVNDMGLPETPKEQPQAAPVTATNPQTGEKLILKNGQWVPAQ